MPRFTPDRYTTFRDASDGTLTATEAAGVKKILLPPGEYYVDVEVPIAPTGTLPTLVVTFQEASDGSTWTAMAAASTITPSVSAISTNTGYIKVTKQPNSGVTANVTAISTVTGTTPSFGKVFISAVNVNRGKSGFNGLP